MARPSGQDFPKHKGRLFGNFGNLAISENPSLSGFPEISAISKHSKFPKWPDLVDRIFQNRRAGLFGNSEISEILEILEIWKSGKLGARILEILEVSLGGLIVTHPMTDHALRLS